MIGYWLSLRKVQWAVLGVIAAALAYYFGAVFDFGYPFDWSVLYTTNATYDINMGFELVKVGLVMTVVISLLSAAIALSLGTFFGLARLSTFRPLRWSASIYVEFFRNTPLIVQLFFWYFAFPMALPEAARSWLFNFEINVGYLNFKFEFLVATLGLSIYTGSFMAEVIRAGLMSLPKGLLEAAYSSGLSYTQALRKIILPLAFREIIPPLGSEFLNNMKNSSLAMVVGVSELCWWSQQIESLTFKGFEATTAASVLYLTLSLAISATMNAVNRRLRSTSVRKGGLGSLMLKWMPRRVRLARFRRAGEKPRQASLTYSRSAVPLVRAAAVLGRGGVWAAKGLYVALMAYVLYKLVQGLAGLDYGVIAHNLRTLLIFRFPQGTPAQLWGLGGLSLSIIMAVIAISASFFIGLAVGMGRLAENRIARIPCMIYIEVIRGNPLILVIFWIYFFIPVLTGQFLDVLWSATIALTVFTGAYLAETVRAGIQNVPAGQIEAAYSTGLSYWQLMRKVVLPQALKQMLPAIVGLFIAIFKDTSLAYIIGVLELTFVAQGLSNRLMVYPFEIWTTVAVLYFICCYAMSRYATHLERKLSPEKLNLVM